MANINVQSVVEQMLAASKGVLKNHWEEVEPFAQQQFESLVANLQLIERLKSQGKITKEQAKYHFEIQKGSVRIVLLTIEGLGLLAVETAINDALDAVKSVVNKSIGWAVL